MESHAASPAAALGVRAGVPAFAKSMVDMTAAPVVATSASKSLAANE